MLQVPLHADRSLALVDIPAGLRQRRVPLPAPPVSIGYHGPSGSALVATLGCGFRSKVNTQIGPT